ncbi:uncharacterized protein LOC102078555 isoform X1 [Oreochromis niloticus]|uniref:uncharacterized protein LOC102078555 isoform X1 n=1 Tax=Oreochromis niloticus TaxID=8128 RepID=UPI0009058E44|nr:uncharacterized protein LOC102078555 isoform X1 [Oreochromis niloticus]
MECSFKCQLCLDTFRRLGYYKRHILSDVHHQKLKNLFPNDKFQNAAKGVPHIIFADPEKKNCFKHPIVGLSALTLCFSPQSWSSFYLCHICAEKHLPSDVLRHFFSMDHYSNYINCMDPNAMSFSWIPSKQMKETELKNRVKEEGPMDLQMLHLPDHLMEKLITCTYSEVMLTLGENEKLLKLIQAFKPERKTILAYQKDSNRKHPLLGMQHLVECICVGAEEEKYYLCTLCGLTVAAHVIIKHILSFDHIFWYFKEWHPSTLMSKECYTDYTPSFESMMLDLAKQTEKIHGENDLKRVSLEPAEFKSINFNSYPEALTTLNLIKKCSLKPAIKPGKKLEYHAVKNQSAPASEPSKLLTYYPRCKLLCQDCRVTLKSISQYLNHLSKPIHKEILWKLFEEGSEGYEKKAQFFLHLHSYVMECFKKKQPVIGTSLIVSCITTEAQAEPFYICFACQECVCQSLIEPHLNSRKHVVHTLLFENPWRLPFGWENLQDDQTLKSKAWEEEMERRPKEVVLKVLDMPWSVFYRLTPPTFEKVLEGLEQQRKVLKNEVPPCQTYSKLQGNESFPLLGIEFIVMYDLFVKEPNSPEAHFLCLLCERRLSEHECHDHIFSREHVAKFLDCFHPGSLDSNADAETLLDLAKQAATIHNKSHIQAIYLQRPIKEPYSYSQATRILECVNRKTGNKKLKPQIKRNRKLVPRITVKDEQCVRVVCQKNSSTSIAGVEEIKKERDEETPTPSENDSALKSEVASKTTSEVMANPGEVCRAIKQEPEEAKIKGSTGAKQGCHNTNKDNGADAGIEDGRSSKDVPAQLKNYKEMERKRQHGVSETSQEDSCPAECVGREMGPKRQRLTSREDSCDEAPKMSDIRIKKEKNEDEACKAAIDKGFSALLKCCCPQHEPVYLCESCSLKISEKDIVRHLTGFDHHKLQPVDVYVNEEVYSKVSKQSFQSAIETVKAFQTSSSAPTCVKPVDTSVDQHDDSTKGSMKVVKMEIDDNQEESALFKGTSEAGLELFQSTEEDKKSTKAPKPASKFVTCPITPKSGENVSPCVSNASGTKTASKAGITPNTSVESIKIASKPDMEEVRPVTSMCTAATAKNPATSSQRIGTASTSKVSASNVKSTAESPAVRRTGAASRVRATSLNGTPPQTESTVVREATCKTAPSSRSEKFPSHQLKTKATPQMAPVAKKPRTSVRSESVETPAKAVHVKNSEGPNAPHCHKSNKPDAPHQAKGTFVRPEHKKPPTEPPQTSMSNKTKPSEGLPKIGLNELIVVFCEEKQQVYCKLCSVKLTSSSDYHLISLDHWKKYVKTKYPEWTAKPSEMEKKLNEIAIPLTEAERSLGHRRPQILKVKKDMYEKLAHLREDEAVKYVRSMSKRSLRLSSTSPADSASASPCDVSSSDDGINKMSELSTYECSTVENKNQHQALLIQKEEMSSNSKVEADLTAWEPIGQSSEGEDIQSDDMILDELQDEEMAEIEDLEEDVEVQTCTEVMSEIQSPELHGTDSDIFAESPGGGTSDHRPKQLKSEEFQDTWTLPACPQTALPVKFSCSEPFSVAPSAYTEGQNQLRPRQKMDHVSRGNPVSEEHSASQAFLRTPTEGRNQRSSSDSHLILFLKTKGLDAEPIVGQGYVLECRGISLETIFLCTCCEKVLSHRDVCQHMVSSDHQFEYMRKEHPGFLHKFWDEDLPLDKRLGLLKKVSWKISEREQDEKPKVTTLTKELHERVQTAPFSEAVKMVQNMHTDKSNKLGMAQDIDKHSVLEPQHKSQQSDERPIPNESLTTEMQSAYRPERYHRSDNAQLTQEPQLDKTQTVGDLDGFKERQLWSPLNVSGSSSKDDPVASLLPRPGSCFSPKETCYKPPMQTKLTPPVSDYQQPALCLHVKQEEAHLEPPCSSAAHPTVSQTLSVPPRDQCLPSRKRPADTSVKTCTDNPLDDTLLYKNDIDWNLCVHLISELRNARMKALDAVETLDSSAASSSESVENRLNLHTVTKTPTSSASFKSMPLTGNPANAGSENQPVSLSGSSEGTSSSLDHLMTGNPFQVEAASGARPTTATVETKDPQHPQAVTDQNAFEKFSPVFFTDTSLNPGQIPQPHADSEAESSGVDQLPISTIVTERPKFMGHYTEQHHTEVNSSHQGSFPTISGDNPTAFLVPSAGYDSYSQLAYVASSHPGYAPPQAVLSYTTGENPQVYTGALNPSEGYTAATIYPANFCPQLAISHSSLQLFGQAAVMMQYYPSVTRR